MKNNILILSAGRRVELVQAFQAELKALISDAQVFCTDMKPHLSSACQVSDGCFPVPSVTDEHYIDNVLKISLENNIGMIVPTIDTELLLLSQKRGLFLAHDIEIVISSEGLIGDCRDKRRTAELFTKLGVTQPAIYDKNNLVFPCFCKPYDGSCSIGAFAISSPEEITAEIIADPKNMFMELIPKTYSEYTVDAYYSYNGTLKCIVPRKRLEVRAGEVSKGVTKKNFVYDYLLERVSDLPGARGCITLQFFVNEETEDVRGLEVNPRFGGGFPLSYDAGANFTKWLIKEYLMRDTIDFFDTWENNLVMLRYDAKVLVRENS